MPFHIVPTALRRLPQAEGCTVFSFLTGAFGACPELRPLAPVTYRGRAPVATLFLLVILVSRFLPCAPSADFKPAKGQ
jgi:hypothetical protein